MSYDLEVRSDASYSRAVPLQEAATIVQSLPGVERTGPRTFVLDRRATGVFVNIDLFFDTGAAGERVEEPDRINAAALLVAYPLLASAGPVALEMAFQIAEKLGWSVYDPQGDCEPTRDAAAAALARQESAGHAARDVLERAAAAEASLGDLFVQEMWNHSLPAAAGVFVAAAALAIWLMVSWEWPKERFDRYAPWAIVLGGLGGLWLKAFVQAYRRRRRVKSAGSRQALTLVVGLPILSMVPLGVTAASKPKVELRPLKRVTALAMGQCEVEVLFRLSVSDGNVADYYCPRVVWEWEDGSFSSEQSDCPPIEEASPSDHRRTWTRPHTFQKSGRYVVRAHLCRERRRVATVETTAVVNGWEGYPSDRRQENGCSPPRLRPIPPSPTPGPGTTETVDEGLLLGVPNNDPVQQTVRPREPRDACGLTSTE